MTRPVHRSVRRLGAGLAALAVAGAFLPSGSQAAQSAASAESGVDVVNTETVQVYLDADGGIDTKRVYEQLTLTGEGDVAFGNPIEARGLRNLDGFGGFSVEDGQQQVDMSVDGVERLRTVSTYTGDLPLDVSIDYKLDGEPVKASDIVGASGLLEVAYTVKNVTAKPQEISYADGKGGTITETVDVPIPMVGSLSTVLPSNFSEVQSGQANMAGDGKGGTKVSFTMTLVPPIGSDTATFGYTAQIEDGLVPRAAISALPVNPLESPTFKSAATSYEGGAQTGAQLTAGATEIDANLLKIRDGAGELLNGLIQLHTGSQELAAGLQGKAAPGADELADGAGELDAGLGKLDAGAHQLADGAGQLDAGLGKLDAGAGELSAGAGKLSDGTKSALTGSKSLRDGLGQISGGLKTLSGAEGLPKAAAGVDQLTTGVDQLIAGFGAAGQPDTLIDGLARLEAGAGQLKAGSTELKGGLGQLVGSEGLPKAKGGVDLVKAGLDDSLAPVTGSLDQLVGGLTSLRAYCNPVPPASLQCQGTIDALIAGVNGPGGSRADLQEASNGLGQVSGGLANAIGALNTQLIPGAAAIEAGLGDLGAGATKAKDGAVKLRAGTELVKSGLTQLDVGLTSAVSGVLALSSGSDTAYTGSVSLSSGLGQLNTGAGDLAAGANQLSAGAETASDGSAKLADGAGELATGAGAASDGSGRLAAGAGELATGIGDAADGSGRLEEGLGQARQAAPALPDGAQRLSTEGMSKLIAAGEATAQEYGKLYATVGAGSERAKAESMAYGAPEQARGLTAYAFEITGENGEGGRNGLRALGALLVGGLGLGAFALRRRMG